MATHSSASALAETPHAIDSDNDSSTEKIEALAELICAAGEAPAAALFVLMGTLQDSEDPRAFAHAVKHLAFTRCGEFNVFGMVDGQIAALERELLTDNQDR